MQEPAFATAENSVFPDGKHYVTIFVLAAAPEVGALGTDQQRKGALVCRCISYRCCLRANPEGHLPGGFLRSAAAWGFTSMICLSLRQSRLWPGNQQHGMVLICQHEHAQVMDLRPCCLQCWPGSLAHTGNAHA